MVQRESLVRLQDKLPTLEAVVQADIRVGQSFVLPSPHWYSVSRNPFSVKTFSECLP